MSRKRNTRDPGQDMQESRPNPTAAEIERAFRERVKSLRCPDCDLQYTDAAVDWSNAWDEGRRDLLAEHGWTERDGPVKLKCEMCGQKAWYDCFEGKVARVDPNA